MNTTKKPETLEEALAYNGETMEQFNARTVFDTDGQKAGKELEAVALALNEGKPMDYKDTSVGKYFPVFWAVGSGRGFSFLSCGYVFSRSVVGARLCVRDGDTATYFGKQFISIWDRYING